MCIRDRLRTDAGDSVLILVDLGRGLHRMGGSILAQTYNQVGETVPDIDSPEALRAFFITCLLYTSRCV